MKNPEGELPSATKILKKEPRAYLQAPIRGRQKDKEIGRCLREFHILHDALLLKIFGTNFIKTSLDPLLSAQHINVVMVV